MKKLIILPLFLFFFASLSKAQAWDSLGDGLIGGAGGGWGVFTLTPYKGNIFTAGLFGKAGGVYAHNMAEWNGSAWLNIDSGKMTPIYSFIGASCVYDSLLFVGGAFDSIGNKAFASIASWNGINWTSVGSGLKLEAGFGIYSMCVYNGELYVGGIFDSIGGIPAKNIAKWNGSSWSAIGSGISYKRFTNFVYSLCVYNGELYAGGIFDTAGGIPVSNIAKWNGTSWSQVNGGIKTGCVLAMAEYNSLLFVGGAFDTAGTIHANNIVYWNGTTWFPLGNGIAFNEDTSAVQALSIYQSVLCVGGTFDSAGGIPVQNIAYWNGTNWGTFGLGMLGGDYLGVRAICSLNSTLYAGGEFLSAGGVLANNIAQWTSPLGINKLTNNDEWKIFPSPSTGIFTIQLSVVSRKLSVEIYNVMGQKVYSTPTLLPQSGGGASFSYLINLSSQPNGVYFYRVLNEAGSLLGEGKVVIEK